jgi:DNA invertase Pin-like site-specific DNA recombinase
VLYCRVSTKEQVEEGNSLVTQEKNCREYASKNNYEIAAIFVEQGESAKTADRTELKKLMSFCANKKNGISAVIAYKIDRISRNTDDYSQIRILLKRYGIEIKSTSEYFEDTPAGRFMENIIANVAQFDNDVRAERCSGGMRDAVREGRYVWLAPYGYSNVRVSGKATIAPNHLAPLIRKAFEEVALNIRSHEEIRRDLIAEGLIHLSGHPISKSRFSSIIRNELYTGWINKFGELHKGLFEPIVSEELFHQVQRVLIANNGKAKRYQIERSDFPLRRFFRHPSGKMLTGGWSKGRTKKYPYYLIHTFNISIRKEMLENIFKSWLDMFKIDIVYFEKLLTLVRNHLDKKMNDKKAEAERLQKLIPELKAKQSLLLEKNIEGIISNDLCKERISDIDTEIYKINKTIADLPQRTVNYSHLLTTIRAVSLNPGELWEKAGFKEKIKLQWFYFPYGIEYDGFESRTTKICKLFKLKEQILPYQFQVVDYRDSKLNTSKTQISLPYKLTIDTTTPNRIDDEVFWEEVGGEIEYLANLVQTQDTS